MIKKQLFLVSLLAAAAIQAAAAPANSFSPEPGDRLKSLLEKPGDTYFKLSTPVEALPPYSVIFPNGHNLGSELAGAAVQAGPKSEPMRSNRNPVDQDSNKTSPVDQDSNKTSPIVSYPGATDENSPLSPTGHKAQSRNHIVTTSPDLTPDNSDDENAMSYVLQPTPGSSDDKNNTTNPKPQLYPTALPIPTMQNQRLIPNNLEHRRNLALLKIYSPQITAMSIAQAKTRSPIQWESSDWSPRNNPVQK